MRAMPILAAILLPAVLLLSGCRRQDAGTTAVEIDPEVGASSLSGPYTHENLTVFLIHAEAQDDRDFLTLDEGLTDGTVKISERAEEQVGELVIDNRSDRPLYLQEGERLQGGKQDRTIIASLVVPPRSGPMPLPAFCIEQGRWTEGDRGRSFGFVANAALAPKAVRGAAKVDGSQQSVWRSVSVQKQSAVLIFAAGNTNSSINETFDSPKVRKVSDRYARELGAAVDRHPGAVGVAVVVNGQFEEANIYPNHGVLKKLFPRLIQSYAVQAVMLKDQARQTLQSRDVVVKLLAEGKEKSRTERPINAQNTSQVREMEDNRFVCTTRYEGQLVHWQLLKKVGASNDGDRHARSEEKARAGGRQSRAAILGPTGESKGCCWSTAFRRWKRRRPAEAGTPTSESQGLSRSFLHEPRLRAGVVLEEAQQQVGDLFGTARRGMHTILAQVPAFPDQLVALAGSHSIRPQVRAPQQDRLGDLAFLLSIDLISNDPADGKGGLVSKRLGIHPAYPDDVVAAVDPAGEVRDPQVRKR
jgi:hypothetical protein